MPLAIDSTTANGKPAIAPSRQIPARSGVLGRRRQVPWMVGGVLLVLGCALAFGVASNRAQHPEDVLAVARPVAAGQLIEPGDLKVAQLSPSNAIDSLAVGTESSLLGRPAAVGLVPGGLLTPADIGAPPSSTNSDVVAVALKAGTYPPSLGSGAHVEVVPVADSAASTSSGDESAGSGASSASVGSEPAIFGGNSVGVVPAVVEAVTAAPAASESTAVVTLQIAPNQATEVASLAASGQIALVEVPVSTRP